MIIWVVVPFSRPSMMQNVIQNFERQQYPNKRLVLVENGLGLGACRRFNYSPDLVLSSEPHQSAAKNAALETLIKIRAGHWATMDDDDYYGPSYLEGIADGFHRGYEVVGKSSIFLRYADGRMHFLQQGGELKEVGMVNGPTISSVVCSDMPRFPLVEWGEDNEWVRLAREKHGWRVWAANCHSFCWCRRGPAHGHTYRISDEGLENLSRVLDPVYDCGQFNEHVINGVEGFRLFDKLPQQQLNLELHPAVQHWNNKGESKWPIL